MTEGPCGPRGAKLHDLPSEVLCLITGHMASGVNYAGLMLSNKELCKLLGHPLAVSAWLAHRGEQQALRLAALRLRSDIVFCELLDRFQVPNASALRPQQYFKQQQQRQQMSWGEAMDTSPLHLACEAGFVRAVQRLLPQVCARASLPLVGWTNRPASGSCSTIKRLHDEQSNLFSTKASIWHAQDTFSSCKCLLLMHS